MCNFGMGRMKRITLVFAAFLALLVSAPSAFAVTQTASNTCMVPSFGAAISCSVTLPMQPANGDVVTVGATVRSVGADLKFFGEPNPYDLTLSDDGGSTYTEATCASVKPDFVVGYTLSLAGSAPNFKITATTLTGTSEPGGSISLVVTVHTPAALPVTLDKCAFGHAIGFELSSGATLLRSTPRQWLTGTCGLEDPNFTAGTNLAWGNLVVAPATPNSVIAQESVFVTNPGDDTNPTTLEATTAATMAITPADGSYCSVMTFNET